MKEAKNSVDDKFAIIAEIQGILDEKGKSKDWILQEIKRLRLKLPVKPTMNSYEVLKICSMNFILHVLNVLKSDDIIIEEKRQENQMFLVGVGMQIRPAKILSLKPMKLSLQKPVVYDKDDICVILKPESPNLRIVGSGAII